MPTKKTPFKDHKDLARRSKAMWFSYVLDLITVVSLNIQPHLTVVEEFLPTWAYFLVLVSVSVIVKIVRVVSYDDRARARLGRLFAGWARSPQTSDADDQSE